MTRSCFGYVKTTAEDNRGRHGGICSRACSVVGHGAGPGGAELGDVVLGQLGALLRLLQLLLRLPELGQVDGRDLLGLLDLLLVRPGQRE